MTIRPARPDDLPWLHAVWRDAVVATHGFLSPADFAAIDLMVRDAYLPRAALDVAVDAQDRPVGFLGASGPHVDSLFVDPARHGRGVGRVLLERHLARHPGATVDVNEQNGAAVGFYERMGFRRLGRSPLDDDGRPYPILHLAIG